MRLVQVDFNARTELNNLVPLVAYGPVERGETVIVYDTSDSRTPEDPHPDDVIYSIGVVCAEKKTDGDDKLVIHLPDEFWLKWEAEAVVNAALDAEPSITCYAPKLPSRPNAYHVNPSLLSTLREAVAAYLVKRKATRADSKKL
jgi:hypothetical protein